MIYMISLFMLALGLAMDAFSVAVTDGVMVPDLKLRGALKIGAYFGVFQAVMPCIGYFLGVGLIRYIESIDHWIAFILLLIIGVNMIREAFKNDDSEENSPPKDPLGNKTLFILAVATSIDALAAGVTLITMPQSIMVSALVIGTVSFVLSVAGVYIGKKCGDLFGNKAQVAGGIVLILIGTKILAEHLFF